MSNLSMLPVSELKKMFNLEAMIETGTEAGYGVKTGLSAGFKKICSCEILDTRYNQVRQMFQNDDRVYLFKGPSGEQLRKMLDFIGDVPTLFWLDAHLPNCHDKEHEYSIETILPLPEELRIIYNSTNRGCIHDVILMDDLCLINEKYRDKNFDLQRWTGNKGARDVSSEWLNEYFFNHNWYVDNRAEGVLIGLPDYKNCDLFVNQNKWIKLI